MFGNEWKNRGRKMIVHPEVVSWRQRLWAAIMGFFANRRAG